MCPTNVRNLSATVHNLTVRLEHGECASKIASKWRDVVDAANSVTLPDDAPQELKNLLSIAIDASKAETIADLRTLTGALKAASGAVGPLSRAHFANGLHSHGRATAAFRN